MDLERNQAKDLTMIERRVELEMQHDLRITKWMDGAVGLRKSNSHLPQYPMPYSVSLNSSSCAFFVSTSYFCKHPMFIIPSASHVTCAILPHKIQSHGFHSFIRLSQPARLRSQRLVQQQTRFELVHAIYPLSHCVATKKPSLSCRQTRT
jgi:hypothetical protein